MRLSAYLFFLAFAPFVSLLSSVSVVLLVSFPGGFCVLCPILCRRLDDAVLSGMFLVVQLPVP